MTYVWQSTVYGGAAYERFCVAEGGRAFDCRPPTPMGKLAFGVISPTWMEIDLFWHGRLQMGSDERAIREVHAAWIDAVNAGDLVRLLTLMADDVVFLNPGQAPFGRDGFPIGFSAAHRQFRIRCISELEEVLVVGEVAYTLCRDSLSVTPRAGGEPSQLGGHRITIYRKQPDGRWLLARDANTLTPVTN
jgi:uncharacterized protein (TIGR02246 family)